MSKTSRWVLPVALAGASWVLLVAHLRQRRYTFMQENASAALRAIKCKRAAGLNDAAGAVTARCPMSAEAVCVDEDDEDDDEHQIGESTWRIHNLLSGNELVFEAWISMVARGLFLTYAIPSISAVLQHTGGFCTDVDRRYADTELLIREFSESAVDGTVAFNGQPERAKLALHRLNAIHQEYAHLITYRDMVYVLSVFAVSPSAWFATRWSWRDISAEERECMYHQWCHIGGVMGLDISRHFCSWEAMRDYKRDFEEKHMRFAPSNKLIAHSTIDWFLNGVLPAGLGAAVKPMVLQVMSAMQESPQHAAALGLPVAHPVVSLLVDVVLTTRASLCKYLFFPRRFASKDRLTGISGVTLPFGNNYPFGGQGCPVSMTYRPTRSLDFNNKTYTPEGTLGEPYIIENMGPRHIAEGLLCRNPRYLGHDEKKII